MVWGLGCPQIVYTDVNGLRLLAEWHEVRENSCALAWRLAQTRWFSRASPVCMGCPTPRTTGGYPLVPSVTAILRRFTTEWTARLPPEALLAACHEVGYTTWRGRVRTPVTTIQLFLLQMLHGHTACSHLPPLSGWRFSAAADCQARATLPRRLFDLLLERFSRAVQRAVLGDGRGQGHRPFLVDGSGCSRPESPSVAGHVRSVDGAAPWVWCSRRAAARVVPCGHGPAPDAGRRAPPHP